MQGRGVDHHFPDAVVVCALVDQSLHARLEVSLGLDVICFDRVDLPANEQGQSALEASRGWTKSLDFVLTEQDSHQSRPHLSQGHVIHAHPTMGIRGTPRGQFPQTILTNVEAETH